ncbi:MAG: cyclase family protein, partial [candidate division NC10 bacterium]|nr:cyclase family protein [candidate division NC10 bacterium]
MAIHARQRWDRCGWFRAVATLLAVLLQVSPATAGALERAILGKSAIVDLSHSEGERQGPLPSGSVGKDFGTRLNALGIVRKDKRTIAQIPLRELLAPAVVVNLTAKVAEAPEYRATVEDLLAW